MSKSSKELYVGKLSYDTTEYDLENMFSVSGRVTSIHLITDPKTGQFKGCGYVRMSSEAEAKDAIASLDGAILLGNIITVSIANPQKQTSPGRGYQGKTAGAPAAASKPAGLTSGKKPALPTSKPAAAKPAAAKPSASRPATPRGANQQTQPSRPAQPKSPGNRGGKK